MSKIGYRLLRVVRGRRVVRLHVLDLQGCDKVAVDFEPGCSTLRLRFADAQTGEAVVVDLPARAEQTVLEAVGNRIPGKAERVPPVEDERNGGQGEVE